MQVGGTKSMGWFKRPSAWEEMQVRREHSAAHRARFEEQRTIIMGRLQSATIDNGFGLGELAAQAALKRIQEQSKTQFAEMERQMLADEIRESTWRNKPAPLQVEAGGATVDLAGDTLTLADGSRINIKTGQPAGNIMELADGSKINLDTGRLVVDVKA